MSERVFLIGMHTLLILCQIATVGLAIGVDSKWAALAPPISIAQAFFPNPFRAP